MPSSLITDPYDYKGNFYKEEQHSNLPPVVEAIVESYIVYMAQVLYNKIFTVDPQKAYNKIFISDVETGGQIGLGDAIDYFKTITHLYPFTVYNLADPEYRFSEVNNWSASSGWYYCSDLEKRIYAFPDSITLDTYTFFNTALDYQTAYTLFGREAATTTRNTAYITVDGTEIRLVYDVNHTITRGTYAHQFEEYLASNKIWDLHVTSKLSFYQFIFDEDTTISPVDVDKIFLRVGYQDTFKVLHPGEYGMVQVPYAPTVTTNPIDGQLDVPVSSTIAITFSEPMVESSVEVEFLPAFDYSKQWNAQGTVLTYTPWNNLSLATEYKVTVKKGAMNAQEVPIAQDTIATFYTISV